MQNLQPVGGPLSDDQYLELMESCLESESFDRGRAIALFLHQFRKPHPPWFNAFAQRMYRKALENMPMNKLDKAGNALYCINLERAMEATYQKAMETGDWGAHIEMMKQMGGRLGYGKKDGSAPAMHQTQVNISLEDIKNDIRQKHLQLGLDRLLDGGTADGVPPMAPAIGTSQGGQPTGALPAQPKTSLGLP